MTDATDYDHIDEFGTWMVETASGSVYLLELPGEGCYLTRFRDTTEVSDYFVSDILRRDGERIQILEMGLVYVDHPIEFILDLRGDGISTLRMTTPVTKITKVDNK